MKDDRKNLVKIYFVYSMLFIFFVFKMFFYANEISAVPDQDAHISYIVYMERNPDKVIPKFEDIKMYEVIDTFERGNSKILELGEEGSTCYLGHPPFYYKFMQLWNIVEIDGEHVYFNITKASYVNILVTSITMMIILYIGFIKFRENNASWMIHFMYVTICTCLPLYGYIGSGINNDNLCNLGLVLLIAGILSYFDKGCCGGTYWLIGIGVVLSVLSKLTAGLIAVLVCIIIAVFDIWKNKKMTIICNKYFAVTMPLYFAALSYFIIIYTRYGTYQPSYSILVSAEEFKSSVFYVDEALRVQMTLGQDIVYYFKGLWSTWVGTYNKSYCIDREGLLAIPFVLTLILFLIQAGIALYKYIKRKELTFDTVAAAFVMAMLITIFRQFRGHWSAYSSRGYLGGCQARYYMPCLPIIAIGASQLVCNYKCKWDRIQKRVIDIGIVLFSLLMLYADFFHYIYILYHKQIYILL